MEENLVVKHLGLNLGLKFFSELAVVANQKYYVMFPVFYTKCMVIKMKSAVSRLLRVNFCAKLRPEQCQL